MVVRKELVFLMVKYLEILMHLLLIPMYVSLLLGNWPIPPYTHYSANIILIVLNVR